MPKQSLLARELDRRGIRDREKRAKILESLLRALINLAPGGGLMEKAIFSLADAERAQAIEDAIAILFENTQELRLRSLSLSEDVETVQAELRQLGLDIEAVVERIIGEKFSREINYDLLAGYLTPPELPQDFVPPLAVLQQIETALQQKRICQVYGPPGAGKSMLATKIAADRADEAPMFWFKFRSEFVTDREVSKALLDFLQQSGGGDSENLFGMLQQLSPLLIFDDLHLAKEPKLRDFLAMLLRTVAEGRSGTVLLTGRRRADFLPPGAAAIAVSGLPPAEADTLLTQHWQLALNADFRKRLIELLAGNPQYLRLFRAWYEEKHPGEAELQTYLKHAPHQDRELQVYLMEQLHRALGGARDERNKLLTAVAFFRGPESEDFVEALYEELGGSDFKETLYRVREKRGLVLRTAEKQEERCTVHDLLREFYYQLLDRKTKTRLHACSGELYRDRNERSFNVANHIEGAHHFCKAGRHADSAGLLLPVWFETATRGYYWREIKHTLERLDEKQIADEHVAGRIFSARATMCALMGEWDRAISYYEQSLAGLEQVGDVHGMAQTYNNLGLVYYSKGERDRAISYYEQSLAGKVQVGDVHGMAQTYNNIGLVYYSKGDWGRAISYYEQSLAGKEQVGDVYGMAQTYNNLGLVYKLKGEWDRAISYYEQSLAGLEQVGDVHGQAVTYNNIGLVYYSKGDWGRAISYYEQSLAGKEQVGDVHGMAQTYTNLGSVYHSKGEWYRAISYYEQSLAGLERVGDVHGMAQTYSNLGVLYHSKGEWERAISYYEQSLAGLEQVGDVHGLAKTYMNLGIVCESKGERDRAISFYEQSLSIFEQVGDVHGMAVTYGNLGNVYRLKGEWDRTISYYEQSLSISERVGDVHGLAQTYGNLSMVHFVRGKPDHAIDRLCEILLLFLKLGAMPEVNITLEVFRDFKTQLGAEPFAGLLQASFERIAASGVCWGRLHILSREEAAALIEQAQQILGQEL